MEQVGEVEGFPVFETTFGQVEGLPEAIEGTMYIVSAMVLSALKGARHDAVAPSTGHKSTIRNSSGHIVSVQGFVSA
jgi:hypothetical protein